MRSFISGSALDSGGGGVGAVPAFSVNKGGTNQTGVTPSTPTLVTWSTEDFDTNNNFSSNRFTPTVAGKYIFNFNFYCDSGSCYSYIYKNGSSAVQTGTAGGVANGEVVNSTVILDMNGTTDYVEAYGYTGGSVFYGGTTLTNFSGSLISSTSSSLTANGGGGQLLAVYATSSAGTSTINFNGASSTAPSFSNGVLTLPSNASYIIVKLWGAGGGGGGGNSWHGVGAGGGGYSQKLIINPNGNYYFTVGAGGTGGTSSASPTAGSTGGTSCFGTNSTACASPLFSATGGTGGSASIDSPIAGVGGGSGSGGDINMSGGESEAAYTATEASCGGSGANGGQGGCSNVQASGQWPGGGGAAGNGAGSGNGGVGAAGGVVIEVYTTGISNGSVGSGTTGQFVFYNSSGTNLSATSAIFLATTTGNIGIGTTSPSSKLDIWGALTISTSSTPLFYANTALSRIGVGTTTNNSSTFFVQGSGSNNPFTVASSTGSTLFTILANGNVGIGSTTPGYTLGVGGTLGVTGTSTLATTTIANLTISGTSTLATTTITSLSVTGTTTVRNIIPESTLTYSIGASSSRFLDTWTQTLNLGSSTWSLTQSSNGRFSIFDSPQGGGTERLSILSSGNVGIGTSTPRQTLTLNGGFYASTTEGVRVGFGNSAVTDIAPTYTSTDILLRSGSTTPYIVMQVGTTTANGHFVVADILGNNLFNVRGDGNVGIVLNISKYHKHKHK
jgi:hypothetical protein